jgi:hypothetical protein
VNIDVQVFNLPLRKICELFLVFFSIKSFVLWAQYFVFYKNILVHGYLMSGLKKCNVHILLFCIHDIRRGIWLCIFNASKTIKIVDFKVIYTHCDTNTLPINSCNSIFIWILLSACIYSINATLRIAMFYSIFLIGVLCLL